MMPAPDAMDRRLDRRGLFHLGVIYLVWGSTYLAIRLAVRPGAGFPPFTLAGLRVTAAALVLLVWAWRRGHRLRPRRDELKVLAGSGLLMWIGGNGLVTWSEQHADSGLAALLVSTMPLWAAAVAAAVDRRRPSWRLAGALLVGFAGVGTLTWPVLRHGTRADAQAVVALLAAPLLWSVGSLWYQRRRLSVSIHAASAWQHLAGAAGFALLVAMTGEARPAPTPLAWAAWGYLVLFGSVIAFTSYITALRRLPMSVTSTYAYANPVIAVLLGRLVLHEPLTGWTLAGAALVLAGIAGVFHEQRRPAA